MKRPEIDEFVQEEGQAIAQNTQTGEEIVFIKDEKNRLTMRSMFEEDADMVSEIVGFNYKKRKILKKELQKEESEYSYYVLEELLQYDERGERKVIAVAQLDANEDIVIMVPLKKGSSAKEFEFAKLVLLERIRAIVNEFYEETNASGVMTINRCV